MFFRKFTRRSSIAWPLACIVATALFVFAPVSVAATSGGEFAVRGMGAQQCKAVTTAIQGKQADALIQISANWIAGYLSAYNRGHTGVYDAVPIINNVVLAKLAINVCKARPDMLFESVAARVIQSFADAGTNQASPLIKLQAGDRAVMLRQAVIGKIQQQLVRREYLPAGSVDGQFGPRTRSALAKFQQAAGIKVTSLPDAVTLTHLFALAAPTSDGD